MNISNEVRIGLFTLAAIAIFYWGFNYLKGVDIFSSSNTFYTVVNDIANLKESSNITINGVVAGKIEATELLPSQQILITLSVNEKYTLKSDARATLDRDILGTTKVSLEIGSNTVKLLSGDTLKSYVVPSLMDKIGAMTSSEGELSKQQFIKTKKAFDLLLQTTAVTFSNLNIMILENKNKLKKTLNSANELINETKKEIKKVGPVLNNVNTLIDSLKSLKIKNRLQTLDKTLINLNILLKQINSDKGTIGRLLQNDSIYNHLDSLIQNVNTTIKHFEENPNHFLAPLGKKKKRVKK